MLKMVITARGAKRRAEKSAERLIKEFLDAGNFARSQIQSILKDVEVLLELGGKIAPFNSDSLTKFIWIKRPGKLEIARIKQIFRLYAKEHLKRAFIVKG